jgi:heterodisulfide reductase subunit C
MNYLPQVFFLACLGLAGYFVFKRISILKKTIQLGKSLRRDDQPGKRWQTMLLVAFGQGKMFQKPLVGLMHFIIYAGFLIINIEVLEIILDGITGSHRLFAPVLGASLYGFLINTFEWLALGVLLTCVVFLSRRNVLKLKRFWQREMTQWPRTDANLILIFEILLMSAFFTMNATDSILQSRGAEHYPQVGSFAISQWLIPVFEGLSDGSLIALERATWWFHILGIMGFAIYVTYSKHLHIALAFPNTYFSNLAPKGHMENMPAITNEVKIALGLMNPNDAPAEAVASFGAKDVNNLTWKQLMDAYSCTECGRCTSQCPANQTGKLLSPRAVMMHTRDRLEDIGKQLAKGKSTEEALNDGKSLFGDYISKEEIMACTTCNACVEACPVNIDPLSIIVDIRRFITMEQADTPASWNSMFGNLETSMSPWKFAPSDRFNWADKLNS